MHRTTFTLAVLSRDPLPPLIELEQIAREGDIGDYVLDMRQQSSEVLTAEQMRTALLEAGNDGRFFDSPDEDED